ncbi:MAG: DUF418 domain-containing protein [Rhizomicrobium sp.]|jgi:uncharacterized protein
MSGDIPLQPASKGAGERLDYIDSLRGFALFGVFGANLFIFSGLEYMSDAQKAALPTAAIDRTVRFLELIFIETKFMGLFALLFGVSFWLFLSSVRARGVQGTALFYRRIFWLFVFGSIHGWLLWAWDILQFYALWAILLPLFLRVSLRTLVAWAIGCAIIVPALISGIQSVTFWGHLLDTATTHAVALQGFSSPDYGQMLRANWLYNWYLTLSFGQIGYQVAVFGRLLFGLFLARAGLMMDLPRYRRVFIWTLICGGICGLVANYFQALGMLDPPRGSGFAWAFTAGLIEESGYLSLSLAYASALALLFQAPWGRWVRVLRSLGRMALTFYLGQTILGLWLFYGFMPGPHLMGKIGAVWLVPIWFGGYALQVALADWWLRHFRFGPAEWLWRCLTYWKLQSFRTPAYAG